MKDTVGERLDKLIVALRMTPNAFATQLGVKTSVIYNLLKGKNKPSFDLLCKISTKFDVTTDWLVRGLSDKGEKYVQEIAENYVKKDNKIDRLKDNISGNGVGDTIQNGEYYESAGGIIKKQLRKKEVEEFAFNQLSLVRQKRERDEELSARPSPLFAGDPTFAKSQKLQDLKLSYSKRIRMDLKTTDKKLYDLLMLVEDNETIIDIVADVNLNYIADQPDPFESSQYYDLDNSTFNIPDTIDYRDYKSNMITWLEEVEKYKDSVAKFYAAADTFLKEITGKDNYGF